MTDTEVFDLLDRAAAGPVTVPPTSLIVDAGRRRLRRRRGYQLGAVVVSVAVVVSGVAVVAGQLSGSPTKGVTGTAHGPTAAQLADGRWVQIPVAPVRLCSPSMIWDGKELLAVEEGRFENCPPGAAAYNPRTNSWRTIATPPKLATARGYNDEPQLSWGGGRLLIVSASTGSTAEWTSATNRWRTLATVPGATDITVGWAGDRFIAINVNVPRMDRGHYAAASSFSLGGDRWTRLQNLPRPASGSYIDVGMTVDNGTLYALAGTALTHIGNDGYTSGTAALLRLNGSTWTTLPLDAHLTKSQIAATKVNGAILATGSVCPGGPVCSLAGNVATLVRPRATRNVTELRPPGGTPYPGDIAGGGDTVIATYPDGKNSLGAPVASGPAPGTTTIYDLRSGKWTTGPTEPTPVDGSSYWTPDGVLVLGTTEPQSSTDSSANFNGELLRPDV